MAFIDVGRSRLNVSSTIPWFGGKVNREERKLDDSRHVFTHLFLTVNVVWRLYTPVTVDSPLWGIVTRKFCAKINTFLFFCSESIWKIWGVNVWLKGSHPGQQAFSEWSEGSVWCKGSHPSLAWIPVRSQWFQAASQWQRLPLNPRKASEAGRDCHQDPQTRGVIYSKAMGDWQYRVCFTTSTFGALKSKANAMNEVQRSLALLSPRLINLRPHSPFLRKRNSWNMLIPHK